MSLFQQAEQHPVSGAEGTIRRYRLNGELMWLHLKVFFLRREQERSIFFASLADVTDQRELDPSPAAPSTASAESDPEGNLFDMLKGRAVDHWCVNLCTKSFLNAADRKAWRRASGAKLEDWTDTTPAERIGRTVHTVKDEAAVRSFLDFDAMLARFEDGVLFDSLEYRQQDEQGERWMELDFRLVRLEEGGDVYAYLTVTDIDRRKRRELELEDKARHDALTGLLNRQTGAALLPEALAKTLRKGTAGAFVIIDLDDLS